MTRDGAAASPVQAARLNQYAALASSSLALVLLVAKGFAAIATGSVAMLASLADTALDLIASLVTLWGVRVAGLRADEDHRFGHGKAEALAALFQVGLIAASAAAIVWRALLALMGGSDTVAAQTGVWVSLGAAVATLALLAFQRFVIARTRSLAIGADHVHYQSDLAVNLAVIAALLLDQKLGLAWADGALGLVIGLWLAWGGWRAGSAAIDQLMDREWPEEKRGRFLAVAAELPALASLHDLRTRSSGARDFAQFHMAFPPETTIAEAHAVMEAIEARFAETFPGLELLIHPDPAGHIDVEGALPRAIAERREI